MLGLTCADNNPALFVLTCVPAYEFFYLNIRTLHWGFMRQSPCFHRRKLYKAKIAPFLLSSFCFINSSQ